MPTPPEELDPDVTEEELGSLRDSVVPARGYNAMRVVGLGGSAGGVAALQRFFAALPEAPGMAFVVVLHLAPDHESWLTELLQKSSKLPVESARDGTRIELDHVYVIPPGKHLTILDGHLHISELVRAPGRHMTVDLFFRSLADAHGPNAVAIVLSGADGDGAVGIKRIKERGGLTIAQDPQGAEQSGMPRAAIETSMVDCVLKLEDIAPRLLEYCARSRRIQVAPESGPNPAEPGPQSVSSYESALRDVLSFLRARTGRDFSYYKRATIVRRIARRMQVSEVDTLTDYLSYLRTHPGEAGALLQDLLISVTNFFRDREAFEALEQVIPELFRDKSSSDVIRVWVPACATGEEAYSIAMLLDEHARTLDSPPTVQIFATDLNDEVLREARGGLYPAAISADVSAERLQRFFTKEHRGYRVRREIREMMLFAVHDLLKDSPFSRLDLVSCRNLLIYLNRAAQARVFDILHFALRSDGRLFLGTSEAVDDGSPLFLPVDKKHRIYTVRALARASLPVPSGPSSLSRSLGQQDRSGPVSSATGSGAANPALATSSISDRPSWGEIHLKLIERFGPPSLLVNSAYDILHLSEGAAPFLQFAGGEPNMNLVHAVHPGLRTELRAALFRAGQSGEPTAARALPIELDGAPQVVDVQVYPMSELDRQLLLVTLATSPVLGGEPIKPREQDEPALRHIERELEQTKRHLFGIVEQHEASTGELKASNEELQAMNEELRSATEELETSREELQSINEELTTVNQELKSKVDELGHTNSDLHNLMGATAIATVFLDRELHIMRFTPPAVELFSLIPSDVGRPLSDLHHKLDYSELLTDAGRVLQQLVPIERQVAENGGRFFLARLLPYRTTEDRIAGVVLTFVDVTERELARAAASRAFQELELRVQQRTADLDAANASLRSEVSKHLQEKGARQQLQRLLIIAQEQERGRISRELHDEVGQQISALMLAMKALEVSKPGTDVTDRLRELRLAAERAGREIHQLAFQLRPLALDELGLSRALTGFVDGWLGRTGIPVDLVMAGIDDPRLPGTIETTIYRVIQEAMNNVYRHASAKRVSVSVERRGVGLTVIVEDDGRGFDADALPGAGDGNQKIGIAGMQERAALVEGDLTVESSPGSGTTVRLRIPAPAQ